MRTLFFANKTSILVVIISVFLITLCAQHVTAQETPVRRVDQFTASKAVPIEGSYIKTPNYIVKLWGIEVPNTDDKRLSLQSRQTLDKLINNRPIRCFVKNWSGSTAVAQCASAKEQDLAQALITAGLAYVDRQETETSLELQQAYTDAEENASKYQRGLWFDQSIAAVNVLDFENLRPDLKQNLFMVLAAVLFGPVLGFVIIAFIMFISFGRLIRLQKQQILKSNKDAAELKTREKVVLASSLEGELQANQSKIDAFVTIYKELLRDLRNPNKTPKYKQSGDIVHEKPALMRMVYDANIDKVSLLGPNMAGMLSKLYSSIEVSPSYQTLEPEMPLDEVERRIEKIVVSAQEMLPVIEKLLSGLNVVSRSKA